MRGYRTPVTAAVAILAAIAIVLLIIAGYSYDWTGFAGFTTHSGDVVRGKTLWDWMQLIIIPATLALGGYIFSNAQKKRDEMKAEEIAQETTLRNYLDQMSKLMLEKELLSTHSPEVRNMARVWTLAVVRGLDKERQRVVLQFLYDSKLIQGNDPVVSLVDAEFISVVLSMLNLSEANLSGAVLSGAFCYRTDFSGANLSNVRFIEAKLIETTLFQANLTDAALMSANLNKSNLTGAVLTGAKYDVKTKWPNDFNPKSVGAILID